MRERETEKTETRYSQGAIHLEEAQVVRLLDLWISRSLHSSLGVVTWGADTKAVQAGWMFEKTVGRKSWLCRGGGLSLDRVVEEHTDKAELHWRIHIQPGAGMRLWSTFFIFRFCSDSCPDVPSWRCVCQNCLHEQPWTVFWFVAVVPILVVFYSTACIATYYWLNKCIFTCISCKTFNSLIPRAKPFRMSKAYF